MKSTPVLLIALMLVAAGCAPEAFSQSQPGERPDLKPSSLEFWTSLEAKTLEQIRSVREAETELEEARVKRSELQEKKTTAEEGPWWSPFADEKTKIGSEIESLGEKCLYAFLRLYVARVSDGRLQFRLFAHRAVVIEPIP